MRFLHLRLDFWMGRLIAIVTLVTNYFLWTTVFVGRGQVNGYTLPTIVTYVIGASLLHNAVFTRLNERFAFEIVEGSFVQYLVKPLHFFFFYFSVNTAKRLLYLLSMIIILAGITPFFGGLFVQRNLLLLFAFFAAIGIAFALYICIDFFITMSPFWFYRSLGPRWMIETTVMLASGAVFPLDFFPSWLHTFLMVTPTPYLVFFPMNVYLGRFTTDEIVHGFTIAGLWLCVFALFVPMIFRRGLRRYDAAGM